MTEKPAPLPPRDEDVRIPTVQAWRRAHAAQTALAALQPLLRACEAIPDFTLSKWACTPGGAWAEVRSELRRARFDQGLNLDAPFAEFDDSGWLFARRSRRERPTSEPEREKPEP